MKNNRIELADVVRRFKDDYVAQFGPLMMPSQEGPGGHRRVHDRPDGWPSVSLPRLRSHVLDLPRLPQPCLSSLSWTPDA